MKYAIYDKAAYAYLTSMEFDTEVPDNYTRYALGYNEYITKARLLDTKEEAADVVTRIESFKFMEKGRFVMHSFDDPLKDQYIISEAGNPTKVVDNITVDLNGTINVKYGAMISHWSAMSLEYTINRLNRLQEAISPKYGSWRDTFDIYKVITIIDEKENTHYQFINVTEKCLDFAKEEENHLNKRIEELEKANYELGEQVAERGAVANRLLDENNSLKTKVEAIKKEARNWKYLYEKADKDREVLTNVIDNIYDDLGSIDIRKGLKETYDYVKTLSKLNYIKIHNDDTDDGKPIYITAAAEFKYIINQIIVIMESIELNQSVAFASADEVHNARGVADDIISICEADDKFEVTLKKFSQLYEAVNAAYNTEDDPIMHSFKAMLLIFSTMENKLEDFSVEIVGWKNKALEDQKKLNAANKATIAYLTVNKMAKDKELSDAADALKEANDKNEGLTNILKEIADCVIDIMVATRSMDTDTDKMISNLTDISLKMGVKTTDDGPIHGILVILNALIRIVKDKNDWKRRAEEAICDYTKCNEALGEWKRKYKTMQDKRDKALERAEKFKGVANSVYGYLSTDDAAIDYCLHDAMITGGLCCGKQVMADILSGKKIPISKDKYESILTSLKLIDLSYEGVHGTMIHISPKPKPTWLHGLMTEIKNLTK